MGASSDKTGEEDGNAASFIVGRDDFFDAIVRISSLSLSRFLFVSPISSYTTSGASASSTRSRTAFFSGGLSTTLRIVIGLCGFFTGLTST
jgi:hypothetical protein